MSTVKISQLPIFSMINANTANTLFVGVDIPTDTTFQMTATTLAQGLYSNNPLNVGTNPIQLSNTIGQFSGSDPLFTQVNLQNFNANGSSDYVATADIGTNSNNFIDLGINNSRFNGDGQYSSMKPLDGYLYVHGSYDSSSDGNLIIGTASTGANVYFVAGNTTAQNIIMTLTKSGLVLNTQSSIIFSDGSKQNTAVSSVYVQAAYDKANAANSLAQAAFNLANTESSLTYAQAAYNQANVTAGGLISANANIALLFAIDAYQNTIDQIQTANIAAAFNLANTSVQNTATITVNNLNVVGNVIPSVTNLYNLGSANNRWSNIYVGGQSIHMLDIVTGNDTVITVANSVLQVNNTAAFIVGNTSIYANGTIVAPNVTVTGNLAVNNVFSVNVPSQVLSMNGSISMTGSITMNNSTFAANSYGVGIIGSANGATQMPIADGTMLQITGKDGVNSKVITDAAGTGVYALYNGRSMRGTAASPSAVQSGDTIVRFGGNGYGTTGFGSGVGVGGAYMQYVAAENFSDTQKGTNIVFATTPVGSNSLITAVTITGNTAVFANTIRYDASVNNNTATQLVSKSTTVTSNGRTGQITTNSANLNKGTAVTFTVNNSYIISAKDVVIVNIASGASVGYAVTVTNVTPGSFNVTINNCDGTPSGSNAADTLVINYAIIRVS